MSLFSVFKVTSSGLVAQSVRLNTIASNLANANNVSKSPEDMYKAKVPVFQAVYKNAYDNQQASTGVRVVDIVKMDPVKFSDPNNPLADKDGFVYKPNVKPIEEMANLISASRTYQNNIEVMNSTKQLMMALIRMNQ